MMGQRLCSDFVLEMGLKFPFPWQSLISFRFSFCELPRHLAEHKSSINTGWFALNVVRMNFLTFYMEFKIVNLWAVVETSLENMHDWCIKYR